MSTVEYEVEHVPDQLVDQLVKGYDALSTEIRTLNEQRQELENKLAWAKQQVRSAHFVVTSRPMMKSSICSRSVAACSSDRETHHIPTTEYYVQPRHYTCPFRICANIISKYLDALKRFAPDSASQSFRIFLNELDEAGATQREGEVEWLEGMARSSDEDRKSRAYDIQMAGDAREKIRYRRRTSNASRGDKIRSDPNLDSADWGVVMEKDFTVPGTPGGLRCPFAMTGGKGQPASTNGQRSVSTSRSSISRTPSRRSKRPSFHDPIRAEICGNDLGSPAASVEGSAPLCPIRFLDQHSPEEVAKYFEKHKHELPRSHELCVKRYQSNEESIRKLDAKYGSLVNMIQGLGIKHQPILQDKVFDEGPSTDKIGKWARTVSENTGQVNNVSGEDVNDVEDRESRFDRPLKEIRLGESPSRPWGVQVPAEYQKASGVTSVRSDQTASPIDMELPKTVPKGSETKCPFGHMRTSNPPPSVEMPREPRPKIVQPSVENDGGEMRNANNSAQMVFTGPVFIGYPMDQALNFLQQSGLGKG